MMRSVIAWFAANRVAANVMAIIIAVGGMISLPEIKKELVPAVALDVVQIQVDYPGADPVTVERTVCLRIEEAIDGLDNIKSIDSIASSSTCIVYVTAARNEGTERLRSSIENRIDGITSFPEEAERPNIETVVYSERVVSVVISGTAGEAVLTQIGKRLRDEIAALPGISLVELGGTRDEELSVEASEKDLRLFNLSLDDIADTIRTSSIDLPAGELRSEQGDIRLRTDGQAKNAEDFAAIPVLSKADGTHLRLGDIAEIEDGFAEADLIARFEGEPAVFIDVKLAKGQDMIAITEHVRDFVQKQQAALPNNVRVTTWADDSVYLKGRIDTLSVNAISGLVLVFVMLLLVLNVEVAFWTAVGTALAFLGALFLMPYQDISLSMLSMFAFILVLGIVVDDAIIIGESIYRQAEAGNDGVKGAVEGTFLVAKPVIFSLLTTMIAFAPMLFFSGVIGREVKVLPILIITILTFSLFECLLILPSHLSKLKKPKPNRNRLQRTITATLGWFVQRFYLPLLSHAIQGRYAVVALFTVGALLTWSVVQAGWITMRFEPNVPSDWIEASITLPAGASEPRVANIAMRLEKAAIDLRDNLNKERGDHETGLIRHIGSVVAENNIQMFIELEPAETRDKPVADIAKAWRTRIGDIPEAEAIDISATLGGDDDDLSIQLAARRLESLAAAVEAIKVALSRYEGVTDIEDSMRTARQEVDLQLRPEARFFGVTLADLAGQVRTAFYGEDVQRIPRSDGDVDVVVRYADGERRSIDNLERMRVHTRDGQAIPFHAVAEALPGQGVAEITRKDRRRSATVKAAVDPDITSTNQILDDLEETGVWEDLRNTYPDLQINADEEEDVFLNELQRNGTIALLVVYALMATAFRSYLQPIVIVTAIPFGFTGAVIGHALFGLDLTLYSLLGMVAASGVVINDNLVLIDAINRGRARGSEVVRAIDEAAATRFRPILLTSITTFVGLLPMMLERSLQAQFLIPVAVSLAFGVLFATVLTLLLVPAIYVIMEDLKTLPGQLIKQGRKPRFSRSL
ncbi:MAG: efflux RND transporter permease subunit [Pseudomonadota bacterium]